MHWLKTLTVSLATITCVLPAFAQAAWVVTQTPPAMSNPTTLYLPDDAPVQTWTKWHSTVCAGQIHWIDLQPGRDYIIRMKPGAAPLNKPLIIQGGRNVRVVGLAIDLAVQPGCGGGLHPLVPGGSMAFAFTQSDTTFIEGAHIKVNGHDADCMVARNTEDSRFAAAFAKRDVIVQNSRCEGVEGQAGAGVHGDLWQRQGAVGGGENTRNLVFENFTGYTSMQGIGHENFDGGPYGVKKLVLRRYNFGYDLVYGYDDSRDPGDVGYGIPAVIALEGNNPANATIEDLYASSRDGQDPPNGFVWLQAAMGGTPNILTPANHPGIKRGKPPGGDFAPANQVGLNYVSPHDGLSPR
jgi:hypothetical protein